jgi:hypothetical protein
MAKRKPGKYDHLLHKYPKLPPEDLAHHDRIQLHKQQLKADNGGANFTATRAAELYTLARMYKAQLEIAESDVNLELEALTQLLVESQEDKAPEWGAFGASDRSLRLTTGDALRVQPEIFAMVRDKNNFRDWCVAQQLRSQMELPDKKTQDLTKLRLLNGEPEPTGIEVYVRTRIVFTPMTVEQTSASLDETTAALETF